jgi:hypothetical protein
MGYSVMCRLAEYYTPAILAIAYWVAGLDHCAKSSLAEIPDPASFIAG